MNRIRVVTVEEQELYENKAVEGKDLEIVITAEEQNKVKKSSALSGFYCKKLDKGFIYKREINLNY